MRTKTVGTKRGLGDRNLADLLRHRWDEIGVVRLGADDIAVIDVDEVATLLQLTLPDGLKQEARKNLDEEVFRLVEKALVEVQIGSDDAFPQAEANQ